MLNLIIHGNPDGVLTACELGTAVCEQTQNPAALAAVKALVKKAIHEDPEGEEYMLLDLFTSFYQIYHDAWEHSAEPSAMEGLKKSVMDTISALWPENAVLDSKELDRCGEYFMNLGTRSMYRRENMDALYQMAEDLRGTAPVTSYLIRRNLLDWLIHGDAFFNFLDLTKKLTEDLKAADPEMVTLVTRANLCLMK